MLQAYYEEQIQDIRKKVGNIFLLAEVVTRYMTKDEKEEMPRPWDYYPEIFAEDKKLHEERRKQEELEAYKEQKRAYAERWNMMRNQ